ncbi:hypothetical protein NXF25_007508 [Crotalus adamanteus]|uniref:SPATA31 domain-containing protein n=1 Tax=Crotalus adamanteus TaxID=8729 RepID=A0AAW1C2R2_CROAD
MLGQFFSSAGTTEDGVRQTPYQRLRQLLCKELACQVCLRVAQEAWQLIYWQRTEHCGYAKSRFRLSPRPCKEAKVSTATSVEEEQESCLWTSSVTSACVGPVSFGPEGTASTDTTQHVASVAVGKKASKRSLQDQKTQGSVSGELDVYMEDLSSLSSSTYETSSISSWTDSSGHSTLIFSRLKSCRSRKHHKSVLQKQKSSRSSPKQASSEAAKGEEIHFPSVPVSFMKEAMIQSLESHWVAKRLQHLLGMSWILLRSLRSFMPSAPASSSERPLGVRVVVRRPRVLAFVAAKTKKKLELHLKKRVQLKLWQLPRRVQEALRHMKPLPLPKSETSLVQKPGKKAKRSVVTGPPLLQRSLDVIQMKVKLHLAKKCVEIQAEVFPDVALRSWRLLACSNVQPLPKLVSHADKPLQARLVFLPFVLPQDAKKMEMVVQRWRLSSCWDLGKRYVESLVAMAPPPSSSKPFPCRREVSEFSGAQTPFLQQGGREILEAHVRKKRLQHEWGLPSVIRRSLKAFLPSIVPRFSVLHKTRNRIETLPQKLAFLPEDTCILLEFHLQRMKLQQRWGLPRRVLETCRRLFPELLYKGKRVAAKPFSQQPRLGIRTPPGHLVRPKKEEEKVRKNQGLPLCPAQPLLVLKTKVLKKLQVHLTKKHLEVRLESFPAAPQISWKHCWWSQRQPLPKLILPGLKTPQIRIFCSSCGLAAMSRIESALQRGHLASLWGLGLKYMEAVTEMATIIQQDAERPHPSDGTRAFGFQFAEGKTPFFQPSAREVLEMHLRKKRIQHQWGLPFIVQRSLRNFSGHMSPLRPSKAVTQASIFPQELLFLPPKVTNFLEFHLQRMKLQQRWGLPRRVLQSCRCLFPGLFYKEKTKLLVKHYSRKPGLGIKTWAGGLVKPRLDIQKMQGVGLCPAQSLRKLSLQALKKLEVHLTKKHLEVRLETFPALPRISWRCVWLSASQPLPKLILPGLKTPQTRSPCLFFDLAAMGRIEVALQRGRLVSLWGLGLKYVEILAAMCPGGPLSSVKFKEIPVEFSEVKSLFFKNAVRENLEMHVKKKRLQHEWGYSILVQRSLRSLIGDAPNWHRDLPKAVTQISLLHLELPFLSETVNQNLELHLQRLKLQRRGKRSSTEDQDVQPPKESRKGLHQNQDFVRTDVELQVHHESCSLTLKTDSKEEGRKERVTFSIAKEQSLLSLKTLSQGSTECKVMREDDWDQGRRLEVKWEDQNKGAEESFREEMGSWTWANSSVVRQPPLAEDSAPSLVALSEEARVITGDRLCSGLAKVVVGSPKDHGVLKPSEIPEGKDVVIWQKRQIPVDLMQAGAVGQESGVQRPLPRRMRPISCSPGRPPKAGKKKQVKVSWSSKETHQERLVIRRLAFDPKLSQTLEVPRQGANKRPQEQRSSGSEKMTILGNILEKKLNLQQGLSIWRQSPRPKEEEGRGRKRDKREGRGGQGGRPPQPSSTSVDKQSSTLSSILQGKLHLCRNILNGKLCFWKKSQELSKTRRTGKYCGVQGKKLGAAK